MTIKLDLGRLDHDLLPPGDPDESAETRRSIGGVTGDIAVGRFLLQCGERCGARIREASHIGSWHVRPRASPILRRPRLIRGLLDRQAELAAALSAFDAGLPVEVSGESGIGKTAFLCHLAHHPRAASFADGVVYLSARHQPYSDVLQLIFEAFHESDTIYKPTDVAIRRSLLDKHALIVLDDVDLAPHELELVIDSAPRASFVIATNERCLCREVRSLALTGLGFEDGMVLFERELGESVDAEARSAAAFVCSSAAGHPRRIQQAAAIIREKAIPPDGPAGCISSEDLIVEAIATSDDKQRRALLALTALHGVPLTAHHLSNLADTTDIEPALLTLVRQGLVVSDDSRYRLADGVSDRLRRTNDLQPWLNRAITYFTAWAERHRRMPNKLIEEAEALERVQQYAADMRRWGEVLRLTRLLDSALVLGARWGSWAIVLERCLLAAKTTGDRASEAWALHQLGTRALCLGESDRARTWLREAVALRQAVGDGAGVSASRANLRFVLAPVSDAPRTRPQVPMRTDRTSIGPLLLTFVLSVATGWIAVWALQDRLPSGSAPPPEQPRTVSELGTVSEVQPIEAEPIVDPRGLAAPPTDKAAIRIFTARPGSIVTAASTQLCYALDGAVEARIDPGIGEVNAASAFECFRVAPRRTTTYQLTAVGREGDQARQRLVIVVR